MTRSKDNPYSVRHEKHVARNGLVDIRGPVKKSGAGMGNWGTFETDIDDIKDVVREQLVADPINAKDTKLLLVNHEAFTHLRMEQST